jgi:hypothetical protein
MVYGAKKRELGRPGGITALRGGNGESKPLVYRVYLVFTPSESGNFAVFRCFTFAACSIVDMQF